MSDKPETKVRVRYAPSPTGYPHVGNIRTALFNWLFARHHNGVFILRIEDTDVARTVEGAVDIIQNSLKWLGLDWDEGPIFQSQRLDIYKEAADKLIKDGNAYRCYCSSERLTAMRQEQMKNKQPPGYDRYCRNLTAEQQAEMESKGIVPVVRFKIPLTGQTIVNDLIRGDIVFENSTLDDFVLLKSDGYPTYHLANVIDDHLMEISHVMRAEEWVPSTPRHVLLYEAMGWQHPVFAHMPMILGPDRSKLSKRHGATSVNEYQDAGYLPETLFNFLSLLGWSLDDKTEIMSREEIVRNFSLERVSKTAAIFNKEKIEWMNGMYIRSMTADELAVRMTPFMEKGLPAEIQRPLNNNYIRSIAPLIQDRIKLLAEAPDLTDFFFADNLVYDANLLLNKIEKPLAEQILRAVLAKLGGAAAWNTQMLEETIRPLTAEMNLKPGIFFGVIRVAVTGKTATPPLFETMEVLGKDRCINRLTKAVEKLQTL